MRRSSFARLAASLSVAAVTLLSTGQAHGRITFDFDYTYDTNGFFNPSTANGQAARAALNAAADYYSDRFLDNLSAITPSGQNTWTPVVPNPGDGTTLNVSGNPSIAANTVKVFAGGYDLSGSTLGIGGPGGYNANGFQPFFDTLQARGQSGALASSPTDFGSWGGAITFDTPTNWNFNITSGPTSGSQSDFLSVALHELAHLVGFGTSSSFKNTYTSNLTFTGPKAQQIYGGPVPLANTGHYGNVNSTVTGTDSQQVDMSAAIVMGTRKLLTVLDWAGLDDLGWDLAKQGDADASGTVDFADLLTLAKNYNGSNLSWSEGDFNYDRSVNFTDLLALAKNYGSSGALASDQVAELSPSVAADWALAQSLVPEPTSLTLTVAASIGLLRRRRQA